LAGREKWSRSFTNLNPVRWLEKVGREKKVALEYQWKREVSRGGGKNRKIDHYTRRE